MGFVLSDFLSYKSPFKIKKYLLQKRFNPARFAMSPDHRFILLAHNIQKVSTNTATTNKYYANIQGGARNVIPLIVHVTHFYYYKNI